MTSAATEIPATPGVFTETASGRALLGIVDLTVMGRRSDLRGALQVAAHLGCVAATGALVRLALPHWYLLIPAMTLHGLTLVTMFAPMHECTHRTAFRSAAANDAVGWVAGLLSFYNSTYYRYYHSWHHRYTQDPARDPELMFPRTSSRAVYLREVSTIGFWHRRTLDYVRLALGLARLPFLPDRARRTVAASVSCQLAIYAAALGAVAAGWTAPLYFFFLPSLLAMPFMRAYLIAEHTLCSRDQNFLTNTRTTLTNFPIRLLMWNMPFHAEHHLFPAVPFHRLPAVHERIGDRFTHVGRGYVAVNRVVLDSFG
ncbi:MAG TPA: fatty acid desaturase [Stellaceae bacterium]|jgi:fatty acid desaturase|nr:fatty acid desaturase [Stellaceae bacterium]